MTVPANRPDAVDPDLDLLRAAQDGDDGAFRVLVERHADALSRLARSLAHNRDDADDVVQETLLGAFRGMKRFAGRSRVKTWLMRILTTQARKAWQRGRRQRRRTRPIESGEDMSGPTPPQRSGVDASDPDLMRAIDGLPPAQREVLVLKDLQGVSLRDLAQQLSVPRGTVESRLARARAELRRRLEESRGHDRRDGL